MISPFRIVTTFLFLNNVQSFVPKLPLDSRQGWNALSSDLQSSNNDDSLDDMRRLLEASWNVDTMGSVPTNPQDAADAAATCIQSAMGEENIFFVDILLPSYDVTQGPNIYDEVLAVEFCVELAKSLEEKSCILVRDERRRNSGNRILEARERNRLDDNDEDEDKDEDLVEEEDDAEFFDDFAGVGGPIGADNDDSNAETTSTSLKGDAAPTITDDVDTFREQLMAKWEEPTVEGSNVSSGNTDEPKAADMTSREPETKPEPSRKRTKPLTQKERFYRLASLFGDTNISSGPDMIDQVVKAVAENGKPAEDEETIIILSAVEKDEMVAVRSLVSKYKGEKNIVLVNCQLDPLPRELIRAETVYSILPLVARPVATEQNVVGSDKQDKTDAPPKVVIMRRYPKDWEVYVDTDGNGFELADVAKASQVRRKKGPPMEWVVKVLKRHMESKLS